MTRVLLVCAGNICRSPTAEGVLRRMLREEGIAGSVEVDSAGMQGYHVGEAPDRRAQRAAAKRGYDISGLRARQVGAEDFLRFDLILAMDRSCLAALQRICPPGRAAHLGLFMRYATGFDGDEVPDPYYGSSDAFDKVLDLVESAAGGLVASLKRDSPGQGAK